MALIRRVGGLPAAPGTDLISKIELPTRLLAQSTEQEKIAVVHNGVRNLGAE
jgi:hypothetical protein